MAKGGQPYGEISERVVYVSDGAVVYPPAEIVKLCKMNFAAVHNAIKTSEAKESGFFLAGRLGYVKIEEDSKDTLRRPFSFHPSITSEVHEIVSTRRKGTDKAL